MRPPDRNGKLFDIWSILHLLEGIVLALLLSPVVALSVLVLWEPFEVLVLSPFLWRRFKIVFGHESIQNSLSDIVFDFFGVFIGLFIKSNLL